MALKTVCLLAAVFALCGCASGPRSYGEKRSLWETHKRAALLYIYNQHPNGNSLRSMGPVYRRGESLVHEDREPVTLKYHIAFYRTEQEIAELQKKFKPTHVVEYDLRTRRWRAGRLAVDASR